jgi:hypothetical protein
MIIGVVMGCVLILFGLTPGLLRDTGEGLLRALDSFGFAQPGRGYATLNVPERPVAVSAAGVFLIALSLAGYLLR